MLTYKQYRMLCESRHTLGLKAPNALGIQGALTEAGPNPFGGKGGPPAPPMGGEEDMGMGGPEGEMGMGPEEGGDEEVCPCCGQPLPPPEEEAPEGGEDMPPPEEDSEESMESKKKRAVMTEEDRAWWNSFNSMMGEDPDKKQWDGFTHFATAKPGEIGFAPQQKM